MFQPSSLVPSPKEFSSKKTEPSTQEILNSAKLPLSKASWTPKTTLNKNRENPKGSSVFQKNSSARLNSASDKFNDIVLKSQSQLKAGGSIFESMKSLQWEPNHKNFKSQEADGEKLANRQELQRLFISPINSTANRPFEGICSTGNLLKCPQVSSARATPANFKSICCFETPTNYLKPKSLNFPHSALANDSQKAFQSNGLLSPSSLLSQNNFLRKKSPSSLMSSSKKTLSVNGLRISPLSCNFHFERRTSPKMPIKRKRRSPPSPGETQPVHFEYETLSHHSCQSEDMNRRSKNHEQSLSGQKSQSQKPRKTVENEKTEDLQGKLDSLAQERANEKALMEAKLEVEMGKCQIATEQIAQLQIKTGTLQEEIIRLQETIGELQRVNSQYFYLEFMVEGANEENRRLWEKIEKISSEKNEAENERKFFKEKSSESERKLKKLERELKQLHQEKETQKDLFNEELEENRSKLKAVGNQLDLALEEKDECKAHLEELKREVVENGEKLKKSEKNAKKLEKALKMERMTIETSNNSNFLGFETSEKKRARNENQKGNAEGAKDERRRNQWAASCHVGEHGEFQREREKTQEKKFYINGEGNVNETMRTSKEKNEDLRKDSQKKRKKFVETAEEITKLQEKLVFAEKQLKASLEEPKVSPFPFVS